MTEEKSVRLSVPAEPEFARVVRMTAANLAVLCDMNVDDVEDLRMAAEEGFVYSCATRPATCDVSFAIAADGVSMSFSLGDQEPEQSQDGEDLSLVELLLDAVCDSCEVTDAGELVLVKGIGGTDAQ